MNPYTVYNPLDYIHEAAEPVYAHRRKYWPSDRVQHLGGMSAASAITLLQAAIDLIKVESAKGEDDPDPNHDNFDGGNIFRRPVPNNNAVLAVANTPKESK